MIAKRKFNASRENNSEMPRISCWGKCAETPHLVPITCEGSCSLLTYFYLRRQKARSSSWPKSALITLALLLLPIFDANSLSLTQTTKTSGRIFLAKGESGASGGAAAKSYSLKVNAPSSGKVNKPIPTVIRVTPHGEYHINLEFPLKLKVNSGEGVKPKEIVMSAKHAAKLTPGELLLKPEFTAEAAGKYVFKGTLRFSVCTSKLCEIKTETIQWMTAIKP